MMHLFDLIKEWADKWNIMAASQDHYGWGNRLKVANHNSSPPVPWKGYIDLISEHSRMSQAIGYIFGDYIEFWHGLDKYEKISASDPDLFMKLETHIAKYDIIPCPTCGGNGKVKRDKVLILSE